HTSVEGNRRGDAFKRFLGATLGLRPKPLFIPLRLTITTLLRRNDPTCVHSQGCLKTRYRPINLRVSQLIKKAHFTLKLLGIE
ncbi:MAG: hypothetical protein ACI901_000491, partial [Octadecabacter sp.]